MTSLEYSTPSQVARVRALGEDGCVVYFDLRNGLAASASALEPFDLEIGDIVFVTDDQIVRAPRELWPEDTWVGVVRLRLEDVALVDQSGRLRLVPAESEVAYAEQNTVEVSDAYGIIRVLSKDPIRFLDLPAVDDAVIARFRTDPASAQKLSYEDFGGLTHVVERAKELVELPLEHHDKLELIGARPIKGVLFTGPPGTGKTMLAKIIAHRTDAPFYEISGPEVMSKWYGESEEVLRKIFEDAATHPRALIFFDEIDSIASRRSDEAHEVSRRVVAQLLTLMDGFTSKQNVVVIATTNRPQDIDAALRRPGRFDWEVAFPMPGLSDRLAILRVGSRGLQIRGELPLDVVARMADNWSAAHLAAIWSESALLAVADGRAEIMAEDFLGGFERVAEQRQRIANERAPG